MTTTQKRFTYDSEGAPEFYACSRCNHRGSRMWRTIKFFGDPKSLLCFNCASSVLGGEDPRDSVYKQVAPAIPAEGNELKLWTIGAAPDRAWKWWKGLPSDPRKFAFAIPAVSAYPASMQHGPPDDVPDSDRKTCLKCDWLAGKPGHDRGVCLDYCVRHCPTHGS